MFKAWCSSELLRWCMHPSGKYIITPLLPGAYIKQTTVVCTLIFVITYHSIMWFMIDHAIYYVNKFILLIVLFLQRPFSISQKYVKHKMASCMAFLGCLWFTAKACFPLDSMYFDIIFKPVVLWHTLVHLNIPQIIRKV